MSRLFIVEKRDSTRGALTPKTSCKRKLFAENGIQIYYYVTLLCFINFKEFIS